MSRVRNFLFICFSFSIVLFSFLLKKSITNTPRMLSFTNCSLKSTLCKLKLETMIS